MFSHKRSAAKVSLDPREVANCRIVAAFPITLKAMTQARGHLDLVASR
ncbi:hypothetical protein AWB66_06259 [Caballeronia telluris]|uniref:Uncharacterized protein n=1 Tax=Caballeronia telluris TaxID=326475 RepID=A0A158KIA7_9BURK|nr:hypothetical protein AWB66_06259 [Caballeronia telluris]